MKKVILTLALICSLSNVATAKTSAVKINLKKEIVKINTLKVDLATMSISEITKVIENAKRQSATVCIPVYFNGFSMGDYCSDGSTWDIIQHLIEFFF